jgi:hypothetical protein
MFHPSGMQIHFLQELKDEGVEKALDFMREAGAVDTIMIATQHDYLASSGFDRLYHNSKRKEHIVDGFFFGFAEECFRDVAYNPFRCKYSNPEGSDIFRTITESSSRLGFQTYAMILNRWPGAERYPEYHMRSINGKIIPRVFCANNPAVRQLYRAVILNVLDHYPIDGIFLALLDHYVQFGFEHLTDELAYSLGIQSFPNPETGLCCFCEYCTTSARDKGIDVDEVRAGLLDGIRKGWIPHRVEGLHCGSDVFDFLLEVPHYLEWMHFRAEMLAEVHRELFDYAKRVKPGCKVALNTYGPADSWKYASNYRLLARRCDWIKPMFYSGTYPGIPRTPEQIGELTKEAVEKAEICPVVSGINGIGSKSSPESIEKSFQATMDAGAAGMILSWDYALIPLGHIRVFGSLWRKRFNEG